ncbi:MAG: hypothetical protein RQ824_12670 [bacterium]|nr:hypothetical protein [bacterium]
MKKTSDFPDGLNYENHVQRYAVGKEEKYGEGEMRTKKGFL